MTTPPGPDVSPPAIKKAARDGSFAPFWERLAQDAADPAVKGLVITVSLIVWTWLWFADWSKATGLFLAITTLLLLLVPLVWAAPNGPLMRTLLFITVAGMLLCLFLVRIWLTVHFTWRIENESRLHAAPEAGVTVAYPQMLLAGATPAALQLENQAATQSAAPLSVTFAADPQGYVAFKPRAAALALPPAVSSAALGVVQNTLYAPECAGSFTWPPLRWVEAALGDECLSTPVTATVTLSAAQAGGSPINVTLPMQVERPERASIRQFATDGDSTGSPLLVLIPSAVALASYLVVRRQEQEKEEREKRDKGIAKLEAQQTEAREHWNQWLDHLAQGQRAEARKQESLLTNDLERALLVDSKRKQGVFNDLVNLADGRQLPSPERLLELGDFHPQATAQALLASSQNSSATERPLRLALARTLYEQRRRSSLRDEPLTNGLKGYIEHLEIVTACQHGEYAECTPAVIKAYKDANLKRFAANLCGANPFLFARAEDEDFSIWCNFSVYWSDCAANQELTNAPHQHGGGSDTEARHGPLLIYGPTGSGKTALARADRSRLFNGNPYPNGLWALIRGQWDSADALVSAAKELLDFVITYPNYWLRPLPAQQEWLAHYWLALLSRRQVFESIKSAEEQRAGIAQNATADAEKKDAEEQLAALQALEHMVQRVNAAAPQLLPADDWPNGLVTAAKLIGFEQVHIFVDDLQIAPRARDMETLFRWRDLHIDVYLLTDQSDVAEAVCNGSVPSIPVKWELPDLWKMALHRVLQFANLPDNVKRAGKCDEATIATLRNCRLDNLPAQLSDWTREPCVAHFFTEQGWRAAIAVDQIDSPRAMLNFWSELLARPAGDPSNERFAPSDVSPAAARARAKAFS